jgi:hypothetical protein
MYMMKGLVKLLAISGTLARVAHAKAVFAHYMVSYSSKDLLVALYR